MPAIVEISTGGVVTNDFAQITLDFSTEWRAFHRPGAPQLHPEPLRDEIDQVIHRIYADVNNGVYRCGFAGYAGGLRQGLPALFTALDWLSDRTARISDIWSAETITEADVRLFTTLGAVRSRLPTATSNATAPSSPSYRCCGPMSRDLFQTPGFGDTTDFVQIKQHYYIVHTDINPTRIVPKGPDLSNWLTPHGRESLGGKPFGDGTPPGTTPEGERVPDGHGVG